MELEIERDPEIINSITAIPTILDIVCKTTGMGYATVARVTSSRWIACAVQDNIAFNLPVGGELNVETTLCHEVELYHKTIAVDDFELDPVYAGHHTPALYGLRSYIAIPIRLKNGDFFGTLCAIDPNPSKINNPEIIGMFQVYAELIAVHIENFKRLEIAELNLVEEQKIAELREQFIAVLGHDLRNPVGAIRNVAQMLKKRQLDENGIDRFAGVILNSTYRITGLIDNLMDFARGRLGHGLNLNRSISSLDTPLRHVIDELQLIWPDKVIESEIDLEVEIDADPKRISQLFLLSNALVHGEDGKPVEVVVRSNNQGLRLSVKNSGQQIPEQLREKIFEPFSRASKDSNEDGLGLYISSEIAKAHNGKLELKCSNNEIEFIFSFDIGA